MSEEDSIRRFERIVAILIQLQAKRVVRAGDLAGRFGVSLRTIYRDIRSLEAAGVPIYSEAGVGYSLADGYRLPPVMFTREEAGTFVAAEKLMQKFMDQTLGRHFEAAMYKIKCALKEDQKDWAEAIDTNLRVVREETLFNRNAPDVLEIVFEAIAGKKQVSLIYQAVDAVEPSERTIEPVGTFHENNNWYLFAWCHLRQDYRRFRADRIQKIRRTDFVFSREHETLDYYLEQDRPVVRNTVRLRVDREVEGFVKWERKYFGFVSEEYVEDKIEMLFESDYASNGFARWFLMFADSADILEPQELRNEVRQLLTAVSERVK